MERKKIRKPGKCHAITWIAAAVLILALAALPAWNTYAAPADGAVISQSGTRGTVTWELYSDGTLVIRPTSGDEGTMALTYTSYIDNPPWYRVMRQITSVETRGTIHLEGSAAYLFYNCPATGMDLSGFDMSRATNMNNMFNSCQATSIEGISGWDTSSVTDMHEMFSGCKAAVLDLSGWETSNITDMSNMFRDCRAASIEGVSGWDTSGAADMNDMFSKCRISSITLGPGFRFKGNEIAETDNQALLPTPPSPATTGKWAREDETVEAKTPEELRDSYDGNAAAWAGRWVWEEPPTTYKVTFTPPEEGAYNGSMPPQKLKASEAGALSPNAFYRFDYFFDHWEGSDGTQYADAQQIPAGTFSPGSTLALTAVFNRDQHSLSFTAGEAEFTLKAGEKAVFTGIPGGSAYQVWEETSSGWQLVRQENPSGTVAPEGETKAAFYNQYMPGTAAATVMALKTIDGHVPEDGAFLFELIGPDGDVVETATNNAAGFVQFRQLTFSQPGTYIYRIREARGNDAGINYDTHTETVSITVEDDGAGNLSAATSLSGTLPTFENESKPGRLTLTKQVQGGSQTQTFTFEIELTNEIGQPLDQVDIVGDVQE